MAFFVFILYNTYSSLKRINYDNRLALEVRTFDSLKSNALSILKLASSNSWSTDKLSIPTNAKSHNDLKGGLPEAYNSFIEYHKEDRNGEKLCIGFEEEERELIRKQDFDNFYDSL